MTDEAKIKTRWLVSLAGGIPLTVLITWVFTAGVLRADYDTVRATAIRADSLAQVHEMRLQKLELNYEHLSKSLDEIKLDVKDVKRILERRP